MALTRITKGVIKPNENYDTHNINSTGIVTATKFVGPFDNINVSGAATFTGSVSIGGTLTYEDVTNVDSVGIITAQSDIHVGAGVSVVGIVTAATFKGDGDFVDIDVDGHTNLDNVSVAGVTTFSDDVYFDGATAGRDIIFDRSANTLQVKHNAILKIGQGSYSTDLYTDGTNTIFNHNTASGLFVKSNIFQVYGTGTSGGNTYDGTIFRCMNGKTELGYEVPNGGTTTLDNLVTTPKGVTVGTGVTIERNGQATFTGIVTFTGNAVVGSLLTASGLDINGDIDVDGHTNLDNVSIAGVTTATGAITAHDYRSGGGVGNTLYLTSADDWRFRTTGSAERVRIDAAGRVSIGNNNTQTSYLFYVATDLNTGGNLLSFGNTDSTYSQSITLSFDNNKDVKWAGASGNGGLIWDMGTRGYSFKVGGSERLRIDSSGRLSAGRNLAGYLAADMSSAANDFIVTAAAGSNGGMSIVNSGANDIGNIFFANGTGENAIGRIQYEHQNNAMVFQNNNGESLRITSGGHISMRRSVTPLSGTSNTYSLNIYRDAGSGYGYLDCVTGSSNHTGWYMRAYHNGTYNKVIAHNTSDRTWFETGGQERLSITSDGKIGIGHHIPTQITKELTIRPADGGGILMGRPGDTVAPINVALQITTRTSGSEAYHTEYHTANCNAIFATYEGGGTGGNLIFQTGVGSGNDVERLRIASNGYVQTKSELWVGGSAPVLRWRDTVQGEKATARIDGTHLYFEVANSEKLRIKSDGKVLIGGSNTTTSGLLNVKGIGVFDDGTNARITLSQDGTSTTQLLSTTTGFGSYCNMSYQAADHIFKYGGTQNFRIMNGGQILCGVGNYTGAGYPSVLQVHGVSALVDLNTTNNNPASIYFYEQGAGRFRIGARASDGFIIKDTLNNSNKLQIAMNGDMIFNGGTAGGHRSSFDLRQATGRPPFNIGFVDGSFYRNLGTAGPRASDGTSNSGNQYLHVRFRTVWNDYAMTLFRVTGYISYTDYTESYVGMYRYGNSGYRNNPYGLITHNQKRSTVVAAYNTTADPGYLVIVCDWNTDYMGLMFEHIGAGSNYGAMMQQDLEIIDSKRSSGTSDPGSWS